MSRARNPWKTHPAVLAALGRASDIARDRDEKGVSVYLLLCGFETLDPPPYERAMSDVVRSTVMALAPRHAGSATASGQHRRRRGNELPRILRLAQRPLSELINSLIDSEVWAYRRQAEDCIAARDLNGALEKYRMVHQLILSVSQQADKHDLVSFYSVRHAAAAQLDIARVLRQKGLYEESLREALGAQAIGERFDLCDIRFHGQRLLVAKALFEQGVTLRAKGALTSALERLAHCENITAADFDKHPRVSETLELAWEVSRELAEINEEIGNSNRSMEGFKKALGFAKRLAADNPTSTHYAQYLAITHESLGRLYCIQGGYDSALEEYRNSLAINRFHCEQGTTGFDWREGIAAVHARMARLYEMQGEVETAINECHSSLSYFSQITESHFTVSIRAELGSLHHMLGYLYLQAGDAIKSKDEMLHALSFFERISGEDRADICHRTGLHNVLSGLGSALTFEGDFDGAITKYADAYAIAEQLSSLYPENLDLIQRCGRSLHNLGVAHHLKGDAAVALSFYENDLSIAERLARRDPDNLVWQRDYGTALWRCGIALRHCGAVDRSRGMLLAALAVFEALDGSTSASADTVRTSVGKLESLVGNHDEAARIFAELLQRARSLDDHPTIERLEDYLLTARERRPALDRNITAERIDDRTLR